MGGDYEVKAHECVRAQNAIKLARVGKRVENRRRVQRDSHTILKNFAVKAIRKMGVKLETL